MAYAKVIVIGASAGGIEAISAVVSGLPGNLAAPVLVVVHISPSSVGYLPEIFRQQSALPARNASDGEIMENGIIYVAPPDLHMVVEGDGRIRTPRGPRENRSRPAIDPLFRSAALAFGPATIGIILSGALDDGVAGLRAIKLCGGTAIVQDPADALVASMPTNALRGVTVDYCAPARDVGKLIAALVADKTPKSPQPSPASLRRELELEAGFINETASSDEVVQLGEPTLFTCPECHGTLLRLRGDNPVRFRCYTGHAFTADSLMADLHDATDQAVWNAVRTAQEGAMLLAHMAEHWEPVDPKTAEGYREMANAALRRADMLRAITKLPDPLAEGPEADT